MATLTQAVAAAEQAVVGPDLDSEADDATNGTAEI